MSGIDWSKAPADAHAGSAGNHQMFAAWYRKDGNGQVQQICEGAGVKDWMWMGGRTDFPIPHELRPALIKPEGWTGKGLPPVGTVVEVVSPGYHHDRFARFIGKEVTIVAHDVIEGDPVAVFRMAIEGFASEQDYHALIAGCFRPIKTPEQIAEDERLSAMRPLTDLILSRIDIGHIDASGLAGFIHDAGYRKP